MKGIHPRSDIKKRSDSIANQCLILKPIGLGVFCDRKILIQLLSWKITLHSQKAYIKANVRKGYRQRYNNNMSHEKSEEEISNKRIKIHQV